ncbi:MAG TPA: hypothetical protein VJZ52_00270 [Candidatus Paceibacterota bacterium]|nr:hypothetical protein [Candidatus Paceibacterota bacterium]
MANCPSAGGTSAEVDMFFSKEKIRIRRLIIERNTVAWAIALTCFEHNLKMAWARRDLLAVIRVLWGWFNYPLDNIHVRLIDRETFRDLGY